MKNPLIQLILSIIILLFTSCQYISRYEIYHVVKELQGKTILIPDTLSIRIQGKQVDSTISHSTRYSILRYIDTTDCLSCELKFHEWQRLKCLVDSLNRDVKILFAIYSKDYTDIDTLQIKNKCAIPCIYDYNNLIAKLNNFPLQTDLRTFLLDSLNRILLVGNPITNTSVRQLYLQQIQGTGQKIKVNNTNP